MTTTDSAVAAVFEEVKALATRFRDSAKESEERRWLPDENIELLEKSGVFRLGVPKRFGGLEAPVADQVRVLSEISRADTATGWVAMIWVSSSWVPSLFPDETQQEVYARGTARVSTGFSPTGVLTPEDGGFSLSGSWKWMSGCRGAGWALLASVLPAEDGTPVPHAALVPLSELEIADDWHAAAASGTGSSTVTATGVKVPARRVVSLLDVLGGTTGDRSNTGATGRNYAFIPFFMAQGASAYLGIARGAFELFLERLPGRGITYTSWADQSQSPLTQIQVATAANKISAAEALQSTWLELIQRHADAGTQPSIEERAAVRGKAGYAIQLAKEAVDELFEASGASVIMRDVPFQRFHRDLRGLALHALFAFTTNQEVHGRALLGLAPDTPFL
ncbi:MULTISPECIES: acyl-CoA dehydrogenase family protein [Streptomyces]|uniref:Acyl-CoA dehydrogenase type 2 domain-containing protein n=1 Tax=Streptomyces albus (strain ATCC 21838 / DSM 41398 / FERM P-419 / JCM 4703 / NBRC 107858) TaxID=1081613 RepID=A0A0B5ETJ9_STRA4|nr:acyl-CoA dehydrogenase family protein [Streptomyces sp. SCSIO ZS0520]AJE82580.1 acyl-CoA dehydrogenase type 2 domain-containing protein [Streptomyces albus]AOU76894.1 acyl-CoA dehydrogenase type 2 domain-containing protein [Streptomyces albus]AYN32672.1 acyl-CoA dehydrogenase [Streptomyces albus]